MSFNPVSSTHTVNGGTSPQPAAQHLHLPTALQGLLEPDAGNTRQSGSEGAPAQQCAGATRQIETAYLEIKSSILGGRVLRARTPTGITQEMYALLLTYQILRTAMADATCSQPGTDPDRASFTTALQAARDQLVNAAGVIAETVIDLVGAIGRHVLNNLMPARRLRVAPRVVKRAISKYQARGPHLDRTTNQATLTIDILAGPDLNNRPRTLTTRPWT